jgi:hypothetical protein
LGKRSKDGQSYCTSGNAFAKVAVGLLGFAGWFIDRFGPQTNAAGILMGESCIEIWFKVQVITLWRFIICSIHSLLHSRVFFVAARAITE